MAAQIARRHFPFADRAGSLKLDTIAQLEKAHLKANTRLCVLPGGQNFFDFR